jgi:ribose-phosphate pyrophosphokinase
MGYELKLFSGNANRPLAEEIAKTLQLPLGDADVSRFSDGEVYVQINENVRGQDVFVIQPTCPPVNDHLMELLVMLDAFKRASARRITAVLPYYGYGRQDRKVIGRVPITAKLVADLITAAGCHRVLAVDLHAGQIQGFFNIPVDHLFAAPPVIVDYLAKKDLRDAVLVSPDAGRRRARAGHREAAQGGPRHHRQAARRAQRRGVHAPDRRRARQGRRHHRRHDRHRGHARAGGGGHPARGRAARARRRRARRALRAGHQAINESVEEVVITNSVPLMPDKQIAKIRVLSVAPLVAEAIRRIHDEESVSGLFV